ncbi:hypothetical protein [Photobacterium marinum]|uniref:hypothetical protein n=1 Tax=Photobacterium marinum TaxID=1056511 RepID=UPI0012FB03B9|nr:hypothetical protein [Photobacterium marinum]
MIDRKARDELASLIRSLSSGQITNDEFEDRIPSSEDMAIREIAWLGAWGLYSDTKEYKLRGKNALCSTDKSMVARWVLFLKSDFEYSWPTPTLKERILHKLSFGFLGKSIRQQNSIDGDLQYWPFVDQAQFNAAKTRTGYLGFRNITKTSS